MAFVGASTLMCEDVGAVVGEGAFCAPQGGGGLGRVRLLVGCSVPEGGVAG